MLQEPRGFPQVLKVSSDPELSPSKGREDVGEGPQLDHFTFLEEISELLLLFLLEPRKDDRNGLTKVWGSACSSVGKGLPQ